MVVVLDDDKSHNLSMSAFILIVTPSYSERIRTKECAKFDRSG